MLGAPRKGRSPRRNFTPSTVSLWVSSLLSFRNPVKRSRATDVCFATDIVAKVFLMCRTKILRAADAFCARRCEGPYRLIQNRSRTSVAALKSDAAAERSKDQLSRDF
jgi:hypothetical protein